MNREKRDHTIRVFMAKDNAQIMLMSLKCGGVGLCLLFLNFAFIDLHWIFRRFESDKSQSCHLVGPGLERGR